MLWYHYLIVVLFIIIVTSPVWFFKQVEKYLFNNDMESQHQYITHHVHPQNVIRASLETHYHDKDMIALARFDKIIKGSKKRDVKKLWKLKKLEYERHMRWRTISQ